MKSKPTRNRRSGFRSKKGNAVVVVFVIGTSVAIGLGAILSHSVTERRINARHELRLEAKNAAEAIAEYGFAQLRHKFENRTNFTENALSPASSDALGMPSTELFGSSVDYANSAIYGGTIAGYPTELTYIDPSNPDNEFDPLRGQKVYARKIATYAMATVEDPYGGPSISNYVKQELQVRDAPLFAHAIFYNLDLEVSPGPKMQIHGPVHTNGNLWVQAIDGVDFHYPVSSAQDMYYGWASTVGSAQGSGYESLQTGDVKFKNRAGSLVSYKDSGQYMDSTKSDWRTYSAGRWNGNLLTHDHGVETYKPVAFSDYEPDDPTTSAYDPNNSGHSLIEPALDSSDAAYDEQIEAQKLSVKAGLRFKWDATTTTVRAYKKNGTEVSISALEGDGSSKLWKVKPNVMFDHRRNQHIDIVEFNVGKLKQLIENPDTTDTAKYIVGYNPATDWNGIVYFETTSSSSDANLRARLNYSGIRLWGGDTDDSGQGIPNRGADPGMTFASNNAIYIKGNFNADGVMHSTSSSQNSAIVPEVGEVPVAVFGDSVTILSNSWNDTVTTKKPNAQSTEIAVAIVSGLIPTNANGNGRSSGGVHNFPRFLENWSSLDLYIRGSLVALYESETDDSPWRIDYYSPPRRNWGFNQLFLNGTYPPGTPLLRTYRRVDYTNLTRSEFLAGVNSLPWADSISVPTGGVIPEDAADPGPVAAPIPDPIPEPDPEPEPEPVPVTEPEPDPVTEPDPVVEPDNTSESSSDSTPYTSPPSSKKKDKFWWWRG